MDINATVVGELIGKDKSLITPELVGIVEELVNRGSVEISDMYMDNLVSYKNVLDSGKYPLDKYFNAIKFVTYRLSDMSAHLAYKYTYPTRYERLRIKHSSLSDGEFSSKISPYVTAITQSTLVAKIMTQINLPVKMFNIGVLQRAIDVEVDIMENGRSEAVREKAANTLINYLGVKDVNEQDVSVGVKKDEAIDRYEAFFTRLAEEQLKGISSGGDVKELANVRVVDVEVDEDE